MLLKCVNNRPEDTGFVVEFMTVLADPKKEAVFHSQKHFSLKLQPEAAAKFVIGKTYEMSFSVVE